MIKRINILPYLLLLLLGVAGVLIPTPLNAQTIHGSVYGGGAESKVEGNATVTINEGSFGADIFGGGMGVLNDDSSVKASADIGGNTTVNINGGEFAVVRNNDDDTKDIRPFLQRHNIYGGGNMACRVGTLDNESNLVANTGNAYLNMAKGMVSNTSDGTDNFLVSEEGAMDLVYEQEGKMFFCAFGGGYGKNTSIRGNTYVDFNVVFDGCKDITTTSLTDNLIDYQSVLDVVGGGFNGSIGGNTYVHVGGDAMCRNLYGGGLYATIGGDTYVDVTGGNIDNVYGGGVMGDINGATNVTVGLHADAEHTDAAGNTVTYEKDNAKITILGSVYGGNDVSGHVGTASINHLGGTIDQNIYGAGNGNYRGYYTPNKCAFNDGENDNYFIVDHSGNGDQENCGRTYKGRPQTDNVNITLSGSAAEDKAIVMGQVFGGGNSCTIGQWDASMLTNKYGGNPHEVRDDPDYFLGGGALNINFGSHVKIGYTDAELAAASDEEKELYTRNGNNVSGLFMGCSGDGLATQSLSPDDYVYHHYYDAATKKYWQGFAVYGGDGTTPLTRAEGLKAFNAYLNNILIWSDDVTLSFDNDATDIWLANFFGGGFRGSMKAKTSAGHFDYTLPAGVTIADNIIGGSYNAKVMYRIYKTIDGHTYTTDSNKDYEYLTSTTGLLDPEEATAQSKEPDYLEKVYDDDGNVISLVRFKYEGGILAENDGEGHEVATRRNAVAGIGEFSESAAEALKNNIATVSQRALLRLNLFNKLEPTMAGGKVSGGNVYGGCFQSGVVNGDSWVNYACGIADNLSSEPAFSIADQASVNTMREKANDYNTNFGMMLFGAGYGRDTEMKGDCFTAIAPGARRLYNAFGGSFKGVCNSRTFIFCDGGTSGIIAGRLYGGSSMGDVGGSSYAYVNSGNISHVYGGNDVCGHIADHTYVMVHGGTIFGDIYGAGNGNYLYQVDPAVREIVTSPNPSQGGGYIYRVPVPSKYTEPLSAADKLDIINATRPSVTKAIIDLRGKEPVEAHDDVPASQAEYLYINGSAYVGGNSSTVTSATDPVDLKVGKYVVLNNLFLGSNGENLKAYDYVSNLEKLNDMQLNTDALLERYMNGAVAVGNLSPDWATAFSDKNNYEETYIGNLCLGGNAGSMLADTKLSLIIPETVTMFGNFIAGSKDAVFKYRDAEHRGGMTQPLTDPSDPVKLELRIRNKWKAYKLSFLPANAATHYLVPNLTPDGLAYAEGCNVYGGCYQSGTMIGSVQMYIESDMLEYGNNLAAFEATDDATKLRNSNARNITVANIYGAGYGPESRNYGNVDIILKDIPGNNAHPSINNIYGGGRNGVLCGHANVRINDGLVYGDVVGGCFAANLYGSTNITVGYPKYYICKQSGKYTLQRGDTWNSTLTDKDDNKVLKDEIRYLKGDRVPQNIYEQITGFCPIGSESASPTSIKSILTTNKEQESSYFTFVNEANTEDPTVGNLFPQGGWGNVDINIRGGVYGGGYSLNNSTAATAGSYTVRKMTAHSPGMNDGFNHDRDQGLGLSAGQTTVGYGGNSSVIVADNTTLTANHIKISQNGSGGIYGDGHLVFCEGFRGADITGYGYGESTVSSPLLLNTFQRFDLLDINDCCLQLDGAQDFAADQTDATIYSLARINELRMNSTINASGDLLATTTPKARNYMGFNKNVHLLGALITNDAFDTALRHNDNGAVQSDTYKANKQTIITGNYPADTDAKLAAFKQRNLGTARNMIGLNSGYALRIQNQHYADGVAESYYGPVMGVCEVKLLTLREGEGGGYVYAKNLHSDANNFLQTSGNFVFPSITHDAKVQYVVDDCFPTSFSGTASAEAHYWFVEGDKYFFNTTLTGYTFKKQTGADKQTFHLTTNDNNVLLSGVDSSKKLRIKSVTWNTNSYPVGYQTDLKDISPSYAPTSVSSEPPYSFSIKVGDQWSNGMNRSNMAVQTATAYTNGTYILPIFDVELQDYVNNEGEEYYNAHLAKPENVTVVLEALDGSSNVVGTYTVNMDITYVLGPSYTGHVSIRNCALPGERIAFASDGITVTTSDQMPITGTGWKLCPPGNTPGTWDVESVSAINIPKSQYDSDLSGGATTGWVHALQKYQGWNIAYTFTAGGHPFTVWPDQRQTDDGGNTIPDYAKHLVVHNYYDMKYVNNNRNNNALALSPQAGARIYIKDKAGWDAFVSYLNASTPDNAFGIPEGMAGMKLYLQSDITLTAAPSITQPFAGELNGDGYTIVFNGSPVESLFATDMLTDGAKVYNLGVVNANSIKANGNALVENCFIATNTPDFLYGEQAYDLSHYYSADDVAEGEKPYINGNRFAKGEEIETDVYAAGDWQYARHNALDSRMLRTAATPNYGSTMTAHNMSHTPAVIEAHDCRFFGQTLAPDGQATTPYPQHLDDTKSAGNWLEANRVYQTEGYYRSSTPAFFYYNTAAWALQPGLTAVRFDNTHLTGDHRKPTSFGVAEGEEGYGNHVTRNLLVYEADDAVKATGSATFHHITGSKGALAPSATASAYTCADLALVDKEDFNAPYAFTATKASYERTPAYFVEQQGTAWEGICMPFAPTATTLSNGIVRRQDTVGSAMIYALNNESQRELRPVVEGETQQDITFFWGEPTSAMLDNPKTNDRTLNHEYWLRNLVSVSSSNGQTEATFQRPGSYAFDANTPYIVSFPGSKFYEFDMTDQSVTFSANDAVIDVTDDATVIGSTVIAPTRAPTRAPQSDAVLGITTYQGTFLNEEGSAEKYILNSEGTAFITSSSREILPFRTYITSAPVSPAKGIIYIASMGTIEQLTPMHEEVPDNATDNTSHLIIKSGKKCIIIDSSTDLLLPCHGISGTTLGIWQIHKGTNTFTNLRPGIYVLANKKVVVR